MQISVIRGSKVIATPLRNAMPERVHSREPDVLNESLRQCEAVIDSTFESIITVDGEGDVIEVNAAATSLFCGTATDLKGLNIDELVVRVSDDRSGAASIGSLLEPGKEWKYGALSVVARRNTGRRFVAELKVLPARSLDESKQTIFLREVTERVFAKTALRESEEKFRSLFEQMIEGVYRSLADGTIIAANPAMVRLLGYASEDELCRLTDARALYTYPEYYDELVSDLGKGGEARGLMVEVSCKDGSRRNLLANMKAIPGEFDDSVVYQGTFSDISDLLSKTYALKDSEEHFRALAQNTPDIVTVIKESGEIVNSNPTQSGTAGFETELLAGGSVFDNVHPDDLDTVRTAVRETFENLRVPKSFEFRYRRPNGCNLYMESVGTSFLNSRGELRGVINTRDVSKRQRTQLHLQQAQKMHAVGQLTGGIAHDFNNLLTVIVGNLQLIEVTAADRDIRELADTAFTAAMRGADLAHRLLNFTKRQPLDPSATNIDSLVQGMEPLLCRSLGESLSVRIQTSDSTWSAKVDPVQLESAILNLAINARDAMGNDGELEVSVSNCCYAAEDTSTENAIPPGAYIRICVSDNGSGMAEATRKAAMEPFFSTKPESEGSGLGLSMVNEFVRQSGGQLRLESTAGIGTRVSLFLPRADNAELRVSPSSTVPRAQTGDETILVVDDCDNVRKSVSAVVSNLGYTVRQASSGKSALQVLSSERVDLMLSDINMPGMTGLQLADSVRKLHPHVSIVLTSGFTEKASAPAGEEVAHDGFLPKPYTKQDLAETLRETLDYENDK